MRSHRDWGIRAWGTFFDLYLAGLHGKLRHTLHAADSLAEAAQLEGWAIIQEGKQEERSRQAFLWPHVAEALQAHIDRNGLSGSDRLFTWPRRTIQKAHKRACKAAGIADYRIKDHRHTAAVAMAKAGVPLDLIQKQLGHAEIEQTMTYARFHPDYADYSTYTDRVEARLLGTQSHATKRATSPEHATKKE